MNAIQERIAELRERIQLERARTAELHDAIERVKSANEKAKKYLNQRKNRCFVNKQVARDHMLRVQEAAAHLQKVMNGHRDD